MTGVALAKLTGAVRTLRPGGRFPYDIPWSNVVRYEPSFTNAAKEFRLPPELLAGMAVVESDSTQFVMGGKVLSRDDGTGIPSLGVMQVKPYYWQHLVPKAVAETVDGNIRLGAAVMADGIREFGSWEQALVKRYFPSNDPNGTTQQMYVETLRSLMTEIRNNVAAPDPIPPVTPTPQDPIAVIVGGAYPPISYGWRADAGLNYYRYGVGHGTTAPTQHTGYDVGVKDETVLYAPAPGVVDCVGGAGVPRWGQGCGAYADVGGGVGNITILLDSGHKLTLGHCSSATVKPGQRVTAGQRVGKSGGMNGDHVHIEVSVEQGGTYWLLDPGPALRDAMAGRPPVIPDSYPPRQDIAQPDPTPPYYRARARRGGAPIHQRADPRSPKVASDLADGEEFHASYKAPGADGQEWYIGVNRGRVPVSAADDLGIVKE